MRVTVVGAVMDGEVTEPDAVEALFREAVHVVPTALIWQLFAVMFTTLHVSVAL